MLIWILGSHVAPTHGLIVSSRFRLARLHCINCHIFRHRRANHSQQVRSGCKLLTKWPRRCTDLFQECLPSCPLHYRERGHRSLGQPSGLHSAGVLRENSNQVPSKGRSRSRYPKRPSKVMISEEKNNRSALLELTRSLMVGNLFHAPQFR